MTLGFGSDHAAFEYKEELILYFQKKGFAIQDFGTHSIESTNYSTYGKRVAEAIVNKTIDFGIAICGSGIGISISVNRVKGVRGALCRSVEDAHMSRLHNNANVICLGARTTDVNLSKQMIEEFLNTKFEGGRHQARIDSLDK